MSNLSQLNSDERLQLMQFVCSFAWADFEVALEERKYIGRLVDRLELDAAESRQVQEWLKLPPVPEAVDPNLVPPRHRQLFLDAIRGVIAADLEISDEERESAALLEQMLG
ncbi:MAG: TerB family tellurite resistance protein [Planctomycetota bacterium]